MNASTLKIFVTHLVTALILLAAGSALAAPAVTDAGEATNPAERAFGQLVRLAGEWRGTSAAGKDVSMRYELTGEGTAVVEHFQMGEHHDMLTVYHLDAGAILLTHYCAAGNQPRMRATSFDEDGEIRFDFVDVTGVQSPTEGHMHHAVFGFESDDRFTTAWTWREDGEDAFTEVIQAERVTAATVVPSP